MNDRIVIDMSGIQYMKDVSEGMEIYNTVRSKGMLEGFLEKWKDNQNQLDELSGFEFAFNYACFISTILFVDISAYLAELANHKDEQIAPIMAMFTIVINNIIAQLTRIKELSDKYINGIVVADEETKKSMVRAEEDILTIMQGIIPSVLQISKIITGCHIKTETARPMFDDMEAFISALHSMEKNKN